MKLHDDDRLGWLDSNWVTVVLVALTFALLYFGVKH